jgi:site-specific DNA-methyltransferase (adenine-specific)
LGKLVCAKGGIVLDPYCGSGATLHAACEEEMLYIGVDKDPHAVEIATARMDIVSGREHERRDQMSAFDLAMGLDDDAD